MGLMQIIAAKPLIAGCVWVMALAIGFGLLTSYQFAKGGSAVAPVRWPGSKLFNPSKQYQSLIFFAHPGCPCTSASVDELNQFMAKRSERVKAYVLLMSPAVKPEGWDDTRMYREAARIPGVTVIADTDGAEARRFGSKTSGQVLLYNRQGELVFNGGITGSRGHVGDNSGLNGLISATDAENSLRQLPVFGCQIHEASRNRLLKL